MTHALDLDRHVARLLAPDPDRPGTACLEAHLLWHDVVLATTRVGTTAPVDVGEREGLRWRLAGAPVGWVSPAIAPWLRVSPPGLSAVAAERRVDLDVGDALGAGACVRLVEVVDDAQVVVAREGWEVVGWCDGERVPLEALVASGRAERQGDVTRIPVTAGLRLAVRIGELTVVIGHVKKGQRAPASVRKPDHALWGAALLVALVLIVAGVVAAHAPARTTSAWVELDDDDGGITLVIPPPVVTRSVPAVDTTRPRERPSSGGARSPARASGRSGAAGSREVAEAAFGSLFDGFAEALDGVPGLAAGVDHLIGAHATAIGGPAGRRGGPIGDGGAGEQVGFGPRTGGRGPGPGFVGPGSRGEGKGPKDAGDGDALVLGDALPKHLIDQVIRRHLAQIRLCYQRQLQRHPDLSGRLVIGFTIAHDGSVSTASRKATSTLVDDEVDACVVARFRQMTFPEPRGRGIVVVSYPFTFSPA